MESLPNSHEYDIANEALTATVIDELSTLLSAIKGSTILTMNSLTPSNPLQGHFLEILNCLEQSSELTDLVSDFSKSDTMFADNK